MKLTINTVITCPTLKLRDTLIRAIAAAGGPKPQLKSDSVSAQRAHYAESPSKAIINTASPHMYEILGFHAVTVAIEVDDRIVAATLARDVFVKDGYPAEIITHAEPEFPDGFIVFVKVPALNGIVLMFWPTPETVQSLPPEVLATLPKREPWTED